MNICCNLWNEAKAVMIVIDHTWIGNVCILTSFLLVPMHRLTSVFFITRMLVFLCGLRKRTRSLKGQIRSIEYTRWAGDAIIILLKYQLYVYDDYPTQGSGMFPMVIL